MAVKFVEYKSVSLSQRFETRELATAYAVKTMNDLSAQGFQMSNMSIHEDFAYSNKNPDATPVCTGFVASISASTGSRYNDGMWDEVSDKVAPKEVVA